MSENFDNLGPAIEELKKLNGTNIYVGIPWDDKHLTMIAMVNEVGATIRPKKGQFLCIPANKDMVGKSPKDVKGLFRPKGKNVLALANKSGGIKVMFILKKSVTIPPRPFLRTTMTKYAQEWSGVVQTEVQKILVGESNANQSIDTIGKRAVKEMKRTIKQFDRPPNSKLTQELKGANNPLIDTGKMMNSVFYVAEK
ncbi:hypothetical protein M8332_06870 (plasmid) [Fructilactobacillus ixorae]|uniref:Morphogenesis protein n=1 Tax=Fructilactobacillus ixorae TaxID=1750535 RepID=A0ABY5C858_9LACO|nr:hypothetical protein [Fructilactobacillus ixorae]USS94003.1 hypothetical protein M8332_06870 [Fructilactobacillus ixorae]